MVNVQITEQSQRDLLLMESLAIPLSFLVLVWVFGGLLAAALPVAVGGMAILGALAVLRGVTFFTDVSIFALNLSTAMGLALAIDYTLLIISRYRDELADGAGRDDALVRTMATAGRTVLFSATTVALSMAVMVAVPDALPQVVRLRGSGHGRVRGAAALRRHARGARAARRSAATRWTCAGWSAGSSTGPNRSRAPVEQHILVSLDEDRDAARRAARTGRRRAAAVARRAVPRGEVGIPRRPGAADDRRRRIRSVTRCAATSPTTPHTAVTVVVPDASGLDPSCPLRCRRVPGADVDLGAGVAVRRRRRWAARRRPTGGDGSAFLTVHSSAPLFSDASEAQLDGCTRCRAPAGAQVEFDRHRADQPRQRRRHHVTAAGGAGLDRGDHVRGAVPAHRQRGDAAEGAGAQRAFADARPSARWCGSSRTVTSAALGTTPTGTLVANMPVLLFCIAFGLSMDYEVFLVSRIREFWLASSAPATRSADNDESVALGMARTGRVITAAAR